MSCKIVLVSVFKNEGHVLKEWLDHYILEGVDTFFLTDNGSNDNYFSILDPYIKKNIVKLNINPLRYNQTNHLNFFKNEAKKYDWVISLDLDEFLYARNGFRTIKEYLQSLNSKVYKIAIPWKMFGSNGHIKQPDSVIHSFTKRFSTKKDINCKSIVRGNSLLIIGVHCSETTKKGYEITSDGTISVNGNFAPISEEILKTSCLHLNHYAIQSWEYFSTIKMTRGDVASEATNNVRNESYFKNYDWNDLIDIELSEKRKHSSGQDE